MGIMDLRKYALLSPRRPSLRLVPPFVSLDAYVGKSLSFYSLLTTKPNALLTWFPSNCPIFIRSQGLHRTVRRLNGGCKLWWLSDFTDWRPDPGTYKQPPPILKKLKFLHWLTLSVFERWFLLPTPPSDY